MWCKTRHKIVIAIFRPIFKLHFKFKYNLKVKTCAPKDSCLVLSNHVTSLDPFMVGSLFKQPLYYMASMDLFQHAFLGKLIKFLVNPIPKEKSKKSDLTAIKSCIKVARENGSICIFPEGNRTVTGKLGNIDKSIVKLAKSLKKPIVFVNIKGGFGTEPRWGDKVRKGKMECALRSVLPYDDFKDMDNDELYDLIISNLTVDDLNYYESFKSKNNALYLERVLFACPICGKNHMLKSEKNIVKCLNCGLEVKYNNNLRFESNNELFKFSTVYDWFNYQIDLLNSIEIENEKVIFSDKVTLVNPRLFKKKKVLGEGILELYSNRFTVTIGEKVYNFDFDEIEAATYLGKKKMNLYVNNITYQMYGAVNANFLKYVNAFYILKQKKEGKNNDFIGI